MKKGWELKTLGEVCDFVRGLTYSKKDEVDFSSNVVLRSTNIDLTTNKLDLTELKFINDDIVIPENKKVSKGSLFICTANGSKSHLGKVALIDDDYDYAFGGFMGLIKPRADIAPKLLYYLMISENYKKFISELSDGANINNLKFKDLSEFQVVVPPINEQQSIVAILDEAFAAIEQAKKNVQRNLQNAKELFQSELNSIFKGKGEGWEETELGNLITTLTDYHANGSYEVLKANVELKNTEDYAWMVRSTDFENNFENDFRYIDQQAYEYLKKSKVFGRDLIISKIGNAGKVYLMPKIDRPCSLAMNLFLLRVDKQKAEAEFIYQYLNSVYGESQIKSRLRGTATKTITKDNVRNISIPYPALNQQKQIIVQLQSLSEETEKLSAVYQQKMNALEELKKSMLHKAFSGELTIAKELEYDLERSI